MAKKRKDGRYVAKLTLDGKVKYIYANSLNELKEKKIDYIRCDLSTRKVNFDSYAYNWYKTYKSNLEYNTKKMYLSIINKINLNKDISKITTLDITNILEPLKEKPRTYNLTLLTIKQIFECALDEGLINRNITHKLKPIKSLKKEKQPLTLEQVKLIEYSLDLEPRLLICYFLINTGLRREELIPLTFQDIDFDKQLVRVNKAVYFEHNQPVIKSTKNSLVRFIPIPSTLCDKLKSLKTDCRYLFPNQNGQMMSATTYKRKIEYCSKYLGIKFSGHQLRHTYATLLYRANVPIKEAQYFLGHKDIRILLNVYTHIDEQDKKISQEKLETYLKSCQ